MLEINSFQEDSRVVLDELLKISVQCYIVAAWDNAEFLGFITRSRLA